MPALLTETTMLAGSLGIKVTHPRVQEIDRLLRELGKDMRDFRPAWRRIAKEVLLPAVSKAFASKTSPDGESWAPRTEEYSKRAKGSLLERKGRLRKSLTTEGGGALALRKFGKMFALVGTDLDYALPLQWGYGAKSRSTGRALSRASASGRTARRSRSKRRRSDVPPRPFIAWSATMRVRSSTILVEFLQELVGRRATSLKPAGAA